ncbi:MAG: LEA type 2 family protein [Bacteroidales bacterium]|nr:LEA type 2 family protein [Bacteroidales bacterium]HQP04487.1 LEA type 2 family protein [Bacteroidales bacterium]
MQIQLKAVKIVIFVILIAGMQSCKYQEITIGTPNGLQVKDISLDKVELLIDVPINNPNNFSFNISKTEIDIYVAGIKLGTITKFEKTKIRARSDESYPVEFSFKPADILGNSIKLVSELSKRNTEVELKGKVKVSKFVISKNIKVHSKETVKIY